MILRPQSLESFRPFNQYTYAPQHYDMRKKIYNFTFLPSEKIGRGYSSIVYKGQNDLTNQPVAIKVIQLKSLKDQNTKKFLQNELQCLRKLDHPNLLKYINSFMTSNNCYIITELYDGGDLGKMLKDKIFLGETQIYEIFSQFHEGYLHFHARGFIHRDIKPSNILIQKKIGDKNKYVIADFGFIKNLDENPKDPFNVGTPVYMAPQSITSNVYTVKSDIWSMGVMLFEMAYGLLPFQCKSEADLKRQICNKQLRLQQIQDTKQIFMSIEFKTLILSCLRKNPQNRISLEEIADHPWFKKFTAPSYDLGLRIPKMQQPIDRRPFISYSRQKNNINDESNNYGFIGNQAIKREKSLAVNHFNLKNYEKNSLTLARDSDISIQRHKDKARQLGIINTKNNQKENTLKIKQPEPYFSHDYLKGKLTSNNRIQQSPKLNYLIQKKNGIQARSSLIEGMKGIVNIKNSQILKINNEKGKHLQKRRQSYQKGQVFKTLLQISTSVEEAKIGSAQSIKVKDRKTLQVHEIRSFENLSPCQANNLISMKTETSLTNNIENLAPLKNNPKTLSEVFDPIFTEPCTLHYYSPKTSISPKDFYYKSTHMLRFIFQNLSVLSEFDGQRDMFDEVKQALSEFFVLHLKKMRKSLLNKENWFGLQKWNDFCQNESYKTFVNVVEKYYEKFSQSSLMKENFDSCCVERRQDQDIEKFESLSYGLLKLAQELSSANKEMPKKSIRNSSSFNASISLIYNLHKCVQMAIKLATTKKDLKVLQQMNPEKALEQMNGKNKDPFRIPKMVIQLKKKLIALESGSFSQKSQLLQKQNVPSAQNVYKTGRTSLR